MSALHEGATQLTTLQHLAAAATELAHELKDHQYMQMSLGTGAGDLLPMIHIGVHEDDTYPIQRRHFLADLARVVGVEVEGPSRYGISSVLAYDWRGSGIKIYAQAKTHPRTGEEVAA